MTDNFDKKLGETLRRIREEKRVSAQTMAERLGVTKQALSYWERGDRGLKAATLRDYCAALGVSMQSVFDRMESEYGNE